MLFDIFIFFFVYCKSIPYIDVSLIIRCTLPTYAYSKQSKRLE